MLLEEAIWIKKVIEAHFSADDFPLLNVGSSTRYFRSVVQPHIEELIFQPLHLQKKVVYHLDMKMEDGVDIVGDLSQKEFRDSLRDKKIGSVLCSNLLEHLADPKPICNSILNLLEPNGLILVTVPHTFPYHNDPIDTMFRPNVEELHALFPGTIIISGEIVISAGSYKKDLLGNKPYLRKMIRRWLFPFYKFHEWKYMIGDLIHAKRNYKATCLLLKKS